MKSTRGHALVVTLAYLFIYYLQQAWAGINLMVEEGLAQLSLIVSTKIALKGCQESCQCIPGQEVWQPNC